MIDKPGPRCQDKLHDRLEAGLTPSSIVIHGGRSRHWELGSAEPNAVDLFQVSQLINKINAQAGLIPTSVSSNHGNVPSCREKYWRHVWFIHPHLPDLSLMEVMLGRMSRNQPSVPLYRKMQGLSTHWFCWAYSRPLITQRSVLIFFFTQFNALLILTGKLN